MAEDAGRTDGPERVARRGGDPVEAIVRIFCVGAGDDSPTRSIPVFRQSMLGAALDRHNKLTRSPNIVAR